MPNTHTHTQTHRPTDKYRNTCPRSILNASGVGKNVHYTIVLYIKLSYPHYLHDS